MSETKIEWATDVWNPVRGCTPVSPGCKNCYAMRQAIRQAKPRQAYEGLVKSTSDGPRWTGHVRAADDATIAAPLHWRRPRRIFVNSMSDLFHEGIPDALIDRVFAVMALAHWHQYLVLTKRANRMREYMGRFVAAANFRHMAEWMVTRMLYPAQVGWERHAAALWSGWPLPHVWLGVSVENQRYADERIPELLQTPAAVRFVSYEPALGPVDFRPYIMGYQDDDVAGGRFVKLPHTTPYIHQDGPKLHWIIVGGESGPGARPFDIEWARSTVRQGREAGVAVFVKQMGAKPFDGGVDVPTCDHGTCPNGALHLFDRKGGDMAGWSADLRVREFPKVTA